MGFCATGNHYFWLLLQVLPALSYAKIAKAGKSDVDDVESVEKIAEGVGIGFFVLIILPSCIAIIGAIIAIILGIVRHGRTRKSSPVAGSADVYNYNHVHPRMNEGLYERPLELNSQTSVPPVHAVAYNHGLFQQQKPEPIYPVWVGSRAESMYEPNYIPNRFKRKRKVGPPVPPKPKRSPDPEWNAVKDELKAQLDNRENRTPSLDGALTIDYNSS